MRSSLKWWVSKEDKTKVYLLSKEDYNKPNDDDEEFREVQITDSAGSYFQINYGAKTLIITANVSYSELHLSMESQY